MVIELQLTISDRQNGNVYMRDVMLGDPTLRAELEYSGEAGDSLIWQLKGVSTIQAVLRFRATTGDTRRVSTPIGGSVSCYNAKTLDIACVVCDVFFSPHC